MEEADLKSEITEVEVTEMEVAEMTLILGLSAWSTSLRP